MSSELWHPFTQLKGFKAIGHAVRARGCWIYLEDGRRVLDGISSWWVNIHGHCHPHISGAIAKQAATFDQIIFADFGHRPALELTQRLRDILPGDLNHIFYSDDGSTAVEVGLKMAWQYQRSIDPNRHRFVAFEGAYHGDTLGAMRVGARDVFTAPFDDLLGDTTFLPWDDPAAAKEFFGQHGHEVVAMIIEPLMQGACGMRMGHPEHLREIADAVQGSGALLIADEVATGFGRTGRFWACEHADVIPDILAMSKGITGGTIPMGATACRDAIFEGFLGPDKRTAFLHGHSYTGNPITCAAALASLDIFEQDQTLDHIATIEARYRANLPRYASLQGISDVRCMGGIFAFNIDGGPGGYLDPIGVRLQRRALREGLYVRPLGNVVYLMPPYCITEQELDWALDVLWQATHDVTSGAIE